MANGQKNTMNEQLGSYIQEPVKDLEPEQVTKLPSQSDFYKVPKRFGSIPVDELPLGCDPKDQYYKIYPRVSLPFQRVERISFGHPELDPNRLFFGDNLHAMRMLPSNSIDLIYIDPPFFSGRNYNVIFGDANEVRSFTDIWEGGMPGYLTWLNARLLEMKRLLKPTGCIYVHLDWHAVHYVKVEMDKIFGYDNFINEIVWCYETAGKSKKTFSRKHDTILLYSKSKDYLLDVTRSTMPRKRNKHMRLGIDEDGREYEEKTDKASQKVYRWYFDEGRLPFDYWTDIQFINREAKERIGYPTQKPESLLERIIKVSTNEGDVVADFFCGGGTTPTIAQTLGRRWIATDISRIAVAITADRISRLYSHDNSEEVKQSQQTISPVRDISIEYWGIYEIPALANLSNDEFRQFIITAYNGRIAVSDDFIHGQKDGIPLYVGPASQESAITKDQVLDFAKVVKTKKGKNHGTMLAWAFLPSAQEAARKLEAEQAITVDFVKIDLIPIESQDFRKHIVTKHREYQDLLVFILPPLVRITSKRISSLNYEFDISESTSMNIGGKIINVQWDFDYNGKFASTQGYSFIRGDKNIPKLIVNYEFPGMGKRKVACKVQDDKGGEKTEILEIEAK
ncbi:MAG TPA: site-specific DNA-methyltransferase [Candidatus Glassbacteria bacterium]|nr:site-specific DNA-methyltransferase [Candidatus Glassbacteria bacterium]